MGDDNIKTDDRDLSPGMRQYFSIKDKHPDAVVMFRMGDFYETFYEDAKTASKELGITLTSRGKGERKAPLAGIPYHAKDNYFSKLVKKGYKVAVVEQVEDPKFAKGLVKRALVQIITPGTVINPDQLDEKSNNYLISIYPSEDCYGLSLVDISTGEMLTTQSKNIDELFIELSKFNPTECIIPITLELNKELINKIKNKKIFVSTFDDSFFNYDTANNIIKEHFNAATVDGFGLQDKPLAVSASGALLSYLRKTQLSSLDQINQIKTFSTNKFMIMDNTTLCNLEIIENIKDKTKKNTLLEVIDKTSTPMGSRMLKKWLLQPLLDMVQINQRLDSVDELTKNTIIREEIVSILKNIFDLERLISKITSGHANARDLISLKNSLKLIPPISSEINKLNSELIKGLKFEQTESTSIIEQSINEEPSAVLNEGNMIKKGYNKELDELLEIKINGKTFISNLEEKERQKTGIKNLRIKFNRIFGYFLEVTKSYLHLVPSDYIRKQTMLNCERFITQELKFQEEKILGAEEKIIALEQQLFSEITKKISAETKKIQTIAESISVLDVICSFTEIAVNNSYVKPTMNNNNIIQIKGSRHPVIELIEPNFISNDININPNDLLIITGPNMAGKSTFQRQVALLVILAQIGSFVPATEAKIGIVDRVFTRVGASDDLSSGQSTFMVEMSETANILNNASNKSLIILDEIGRGTSTFDGVSIAWSVAEYIYNKVKAKTLFATHYHVLNKLADKFENIKNYNIAVKEDKDRIIFLRKIIEGSTDRSYGIHVANLAGMPKDVIDRAKDIQRNLEEEDKMSKKINAKKHVQQLSLTDL
jgi:DNA mismatch repair protein MutS